MLCRCRIGERSGGFAGNGVASGARPGGARPSRSSGRFSSSLAEFGLLAAVYQRAAPVRAERIVVASLQGELAASDGRPSAALAHDTQAALARLRSLGLSQADLAQPVPKLAATLKARQHRMDIEAMLIYVGLLIFASFGWMVWFRRLVSRHRALQQQFTAEQSRAEGEQRLAALVRNAADVVIVCGLDAEASFVTASATSVLGMDPEALIGTRCLDLVAPRGSRGLPASAERRRRRRGPRRCGCGCVTRTAGCCTSRERSPT